MENTPPPDGKTKASVNLTAIIITIVICTTGLIALFFSQSKIGPNGGSSLIALKPEVPAFISWRETKLPGQTQVARIWAKPEGQFPLRVIVQVESAVSAEKKLKEVILERRHIEDPFELGFLEGHGFVPGDKISVGHKDFSPVSSTCKPLK